MREFKDILKSLRLDKEMTQDELANVLKTTKQAISHYERGTRYPKPDMLDAISDYFNVDMDYITGRSSRTSRLLSDEELRLLNAYRSASEEIKTAACAVLSIKR